MVLMQRVSAWVGHIQVFKAYIEIYTVSSVTAWNMDSFKLHVFL
jgi:hypothetical protein